MSLTFSLYDEMLSYGLFALCNSNRCNHSPKEIMECFIYIEVWNSAIFVLDKNPIVIQTMGLDTNIYVKHFVMNRIYLKVIE
jgi:hypothetical protein